jgi:hypothetical protein
MLKKVIFLDVDGVLNCATTKERWHGVIGMEKEKVNLFNDIIERTGASVVLSSYWRLNDDWEKIMKKNGLKCKFLGRTEHFWQKDRGYEIKDWLDKNKVEKYVIIDDDSDMLEGQKLFQTSWKIGLTKEISEQIIAYLNEGGEECDSCGSTDLWKNSSGDTNCNNCGTDGRD